MTLREAIDVARTRGGGLIYRESAERPYTVPTEGKIRNPEGFLPAWTSVELNATDWRVWAGATL